MTAITIENISKRYIINHRSDGRDALRHALEAAVRSPLVWLRERRQRASQATEEFWALRGVSFSVEQGDVVGVIGRNGAGKSTLLKILSRITQPTEGRIHLRGRVASLLEVGTGFHQDLTGRENIFLNGSILGMRHSEIREKLDEIVAFSEIEKFLDTPVKRYSSGMYVRLAFSVAAHLEPEILIVDEVLAVGDAQFQSKCLGKMQDVAKGGRTALFVSHNMASVEQLCNRAVLLNRGVVTATGPSRNVIAEYLQNTVSNTQSLISSVVQRSGTGALRLTSVHLEDPSGNPIDYAQSGKDVAVVLGYRCAEGETPRNVDVGISLHASDTTMLSVLYTSYMRRPFQDIPPVGTFRFKLAQLPLKEGQYLIGARVVASGDELDWPQEPVGRLDVISGDFYGTGVKGYEGAAPMLLNGECTVTAS